MTARATRSEEPHDRLTRMCAAMTAAFDAHAEHREGDKCIVFLDDDDRGGLQIHDYEDDTDAIVDLLVHLRAIFEANGKHLLIGALPDNDESAAKVDRVAAALESCYGPFEPRKWAERVVAALEAA